MELERIRNAVSPYVPRRVRPVARIPYRACKRISRWYANFDNQRYVKRCMKQTRLDHLPPTDLILRVNGSADIRSFLDAGKKCSQDIESSLVKVNRNMREFQSILDFGCGCGRTLMWFANRASDHSLYGTDIDSDAISWCRDNLRFGSFEVNSALPPLDYPSDKFDLVYAISVLTHLDEDYQFRWLSELKRIVKPKGILLATVHGQYCWKDLPPEPMATIQEHGFVFVPVGAWKGVFPDWYQLTFHTQGYVEERFAEYFKVLDYVPRGLNNHQDMIVLQKT